MLKVTGWLGGGVWWVAYRILVSAPGPLELIGESMGVLGLGVRD